MRARIAHLVVAFLLLSLATAGAASACSLSVTNQWTGAALNGNWSDAGNWSAGVPTGSQVVCIPASGAATVDLPAAVAAAIEVDASSSLTISVGNQLTVGPTIGPSSVLSGAIIVGGVLSLNTNATYGAGSIAVDGSLSVESARQLAITGGRDITGFGTLAIGGTVTTSGSAANPVEIATGISNAGTFANGNGITRLTGGSSGTGLWKVGSGSGTDRPVLELTGPSNFSMDGEVSDAATGGLGAVVVDGVHVFGTADTAAIDVYELTVRGAAGGLDYTPFGGPAVAVTIDYFTIEDGLVDMSTGMTTHLTDLQAGQLVGIGTWTANKFEWSGGDLGGNGGQSFTVGTLDMSGSGTRTVADRTITVTGAGTQDYPYAAGTLELTGNTNLVIGDGVRWVIGGDVDVTNTGGGGQIVNHGVIDKSIGAGGAAQSDIAPQLNMPDGELRVRQGIMELGVAPTQYNGSTLTAGRYVLTGTLRFPGAMTSFGTDIVFNGIDAHLIDTGGGDALQTITSNAAGKTLTLGGGVVLDVPIGSDFTNNGTVSVTGGSSIDLEPNQDYVQSSSDAVTNLAGAASQINTSGTGFVNLALGTLSGVGTITGAVANNGGTLAPGNSPGTLTINGDYSQSGTGLLLQEIEGPDPSQYDRLVVSGTANLDGVMVLQSTAGYQPADGQAFDVITAGNRVGSFDTIFQFPGAPYMDAYYGGAPALRLVANSVSIGDAGVGETGEATFTITLGTAAPQTVSVNWATQDGTATAGSDYAAAGGTVSFAPGETSKTVAVPILGDTAAEGGENFAVNLSSPAGTLVRDGQGVGTIADDDAPPVAVTAQVPPDDIDGFAVAPPPVQGKTVNVEPVSGTVLVKLPRARRFVRLPDAEQVPVGTTVDARKGVVRLYSVGRGGRIQAANFSEGMFVVTQRPGQALTNLRLTGGNFTRACGRTSRAQSSAVRRRSKSVRHLWGNGSGQFRTTGRFASATIRGTRWLTDDRCNGTLIRVTAGAVTVRDQTLRKTIVLKRPKSYLAPAVKPRRRR